MPDNNEDQVSRRRALGAGAALICWGVAPAQAQTAAVFGQAAVPGPDNIVVTLLGTGSPDLRPDRFGPSTLVQAGGLKLVFDAGRGCTVRLNQCGVPLGKVDAVFITHYHSDHLNGLPDLWMMSYLPPAFGRRIQPLELWGPKGIGRIATTMRETFSDDVRIRESDERVPAAGTEISPHEFTADGTVFELNGVRVTALEVNPGR